MIPTVEQRRAFKLPAANEEINTPSGTVNTVSNPHHNESAQNSRIAAKSCHESRGKILWINFRIFAKFARTLSEGGRVPRVRVVFYREENGSVPVLDWFDALPPRAQDKLRIRIQRLAELGHELRRPEADILRDGIHELRVGLQHLNYRILYFFYGRIAAVLVHGLTKQDRVPDAAIEAATARRRKFEEAPGLHTLEER